MAAAAADVFLAHGHIAGSGASRYRVPSPCCRGWGLVALRNIYTLSILLSQSCFLKLARETSHLSIVVVCLSAYEHMSSSHLQHFLVPIIINFIKGAYTVWFELILVTCIPLELQFGYIISDT